MTAELPNKPAEHTTDPCDLCGSLDRELLATSDRNRQPLLTGICRRCGLVAHWQRPTEQELMAFYASEYRHSYHGEYTPSPRRVLRAWGNGLRIVAQLAPFVERGQSVFEVGAGIGCTIKAFEAAGYRAAGIDPGKGFQQFSREELRANLDLGNLFDLPPQPHPMHDLILLVHVLEHFRSPRRALEHIHGILRPGGLLYVECPNLAAPFATRPRLFHFAHVTNFTSSSLRMLAKSCGFRVVRFFGDERTSNIEVLLESCEVFRLDIDETNYSRTLAAINRYNWLTYAVRPSYLLNRVAKLFSYLVEYLIGSWWLKRFVRVCQSVAKNGQ